MILEGSIVIFLLSVIALELRRIERILPVPLSERPAVPAEPEPQYNQLGRPDASVHFAAHEILNASGDVVGTVPHHLGITEEIKAALRTPGMAVRWAWGVVEPGKE